MSRRDVAVLAFVLTGIYLLVEASQLLIGIAYVLYAAVTGLLEGDFHWSPATLFSLAPLIPFVLLAVAGVLLISKRHRLAAWLFPGEDVPARLSPRPGHLQAVAFSVVGVIFFSDSLHRLLTFFGNMAFAAQWKGEPININNWMHLTEMVMGLIIGLLLFFGARKLALLWHSFRKFGTRPSDQP